MALILNDWHMLLPITGLLGALFLSPALARWVILTGILVYLALNFPDGTTTTGEEKTFALLAGAVAFLAVLKSKHFPSKIQSFCLASCQLCLALLFTATDLQAFAVSIAAYSFLLFILVGVNVSEKLSEVSALALLGSFLLVLSSALPAGSAPAMALVLIAAAFLGPVAPASPGLRALLQGRNLPAKILALGLGPLLSQWVVKKSPIDPAFCNGWPIFAVGFCHLFGAWLAWQSRRWSDWLAAAISISVSFSLLGVLSGSPSGVGYVGGAALSASIFALVIDWIERHSPGDGGTFRKLPFASVLALFSFGGVLGFPKAPAAASHPWILVLVATAWSCLAVSGLKLLLPLFLSEPSELTAAKDIGALAFALGLALCVAAMTVRNL